MLSKRDSSPDIILVWHQGALGDFLLAVPVFQGLQRLYPGIIINFCSRSSHTQLLATEPYYGSSYSTESVALASIYHDAIWRNTQLPTYFHDACAIFMFGQARSRILADRLSLLLQKQVVWIQSFPDMDCGKPIADYLLDQLQQFGWDIEYMNPLITPLPEERSFVLGWIAAMGLKERPKPIVIHPGSGGRNKIWPLRNFYSILKWLCTEFPHPVIMVLGQADEHLKPLAEEVKKLGVFLLEDLPLERLAAFLAESSLYIGNDSGVSHLAAAIGVPTVAIFGPTRPEVWAPRGTSVTIIKDQWDASDNLLWPAESDMKGIDKRLMTNLKKVLD